MKNTPILLFSVLLSLIFLLGCSSIHQIRTNNSLNDNQNSIVKGDNSQNEYPEAINFHNLSYCDSLPLNAPFGEHSKLGCYIAYAEFYNDTSVCDESGNLKSDCLSNYARDKSDLTVCINLGASWLKEYCERDIIERYGGNHYPLDTVCNQINESSEKLNCQDIAKKNDPNYTFNSSTVNWTGCSYADANITLFFGVYHDTFKINDELFNISSRGLLSQHSNVEVLLLINNENISLTAGQSAKLHDGSLIKFLGQIESTSGRVEPICIFLKGNNHNS